MRLAQLARKLSVRQDEIVEFLASNAIQVEESANTKLEEDHVRLLIAHFAPAMEADKVTELAQEQDEPAPIAVIQPAPEMVGEILLPEPEPINTEAIQSEAPEEKSEVIRAPKVELTGLKVLGKIELVEKKKKTETPDAETPVEATENKPRPREHRQDRQPKSKSNTRPVKNPLALAREREMKEAEEKRRQEIEKRKEIRTQNYLKKVKANTPVKRIKPEEPKTQTVIQKREEPTTWVGKFLRWLTT